MLSLTAVRASALHSLKQEGNINTKQGVIRRAGGCNQLGYVTIPSDFYATRTFIRITDTGYESWFKNKIFGRM